MRLSANTLDALARDTDARHSRRRTLRGIGIGALATVVARPLSARAGKVAKKAKKRSKKKCRRQVDACRNVFIDLCDTTGECEDEILEGVLACCAHLSDCKAGAALDCFLVTAS